MLSLVTCLLWGVVHLTIVEWSLYTRKQCSFWMEEACYWNSSENVVPWARLFCFLVWLMLPPVFLIMAVTGSYNHFMRTFHTPTTSPIAFMLKQFFSFKLGLLILAKSRLFPDWNSLHSNFYPRLRSLNLFKNLWCCWDLSIAEVKPKVFLKAELLNPKHNDLSFLRDTLLLRTLVSKNSNSTSSGRTTHRDSNTPRVYN